MRRISLRWRRARPNGRSAIRPTIALAALVLTITACDKQSADLSRKNDSGAESDAQVIGAKEHEPVTAPTNYRRLRPLFWSRLYRDGGTTLYCNERFEQQRGKGFNIEHVMPMAWVVKALGCGSRKLCRATNQRFNVIESDLHNLYPTLTALNDARASYAFGTIEGESYAFDNCEFEVSHQHRIVEPAPAARGEIARAVLYMEQTYGVEVFARQRRLLLEWDRLDPISAEELRRNDVIERLQGRRNPFIDNADRSRTSENL